MDANGNPESIPRRERSDRGFRIVMISIALLVLGSCAGVIGYIVETPMASVSYIFRAEFEELPVDDANLEAWYEAQPHVARIFIDRKSKTLKIIVIMTQNLRYQPPCPDPCPEFERLGYRGLKVFEPVRS